MKPRRRSVTPAEIQMRVFAGRAIIGAAIPEQCTTLPHLQLRRSAPAPCRPSVQSNPRDPTAWATSRWPAVQRACLAAALRRLHRCKASPATSAADPHRCPADPADTACASEIVGSRSTHALVPPSPRIHPRSTSPPQSCTASQKTDTAASASVHPHCSSSPRVPSN